MIQALPTVALTAVATRPSLAVPAADLEEFLRLPLALEEGKPGPRAVVNGYLRAFELIAEAATVQEGCAQAAREFRGCRGFSRGNLYTLYSLYKKGGRKRDSRGQLTGPTYEPGDWRCLLPNYSPGKGSQPIEFIDHLVGLKARTTRKDIVAGIRQVLIDEWLHGTHIPGYGTAEAWYRERGRFMPDARRLVRDRDLPEGWSLSNLRRLLARRLRRRSQKTLVETGFHDAHGAFAAQLLRDRSRLRPLELVTFDDVRFDVKVVMRTGNTWQVCYPLGLLALDVATGAIIGVGVKPAAKRVEIDGAETDQAAGTRMAISRRETCYLLLQILERLGLPPYTMNLLLENASAALTAEDERAFLTLMGGRLQIEKTGMARRKLLKSGFVEQGGMPWQKGWIEAFFRKLHTSINHLPGASGARYQLDPGELDDRVRTTLSLLKRAGQHGVSIESLRLPLLTMDQFSYMLHHWVERLNWRIDHHLQGFDTVLETQDAAGRWLRFEDCEDLPLGAELVERMEAPLERLTRLARGHQFATLPPSVLLPLYADKRPVRIRNGRIQFTDKHLSRDPLVFFERGNPVLAEANEGRPCLGFLREDLSLLHVTDEHYAYLGSVPNQRRIDVLDTRAIKQAAGQVHADRCAERDTVRDILRPLEREAAADRAHNERVLTAGAAMAEADEVHVRRAAAAPKPAARQLQQTQRWAEAAARARREDDDAF